MRVIVIPIYWPEWDLSASWFFHYLRKVSQQFGVAGWMPIWVSMVSFNPQFLLKPWIDRDRRKPKSWNNHEICANPHSRFFFFFLFYLDTDCTLILKIFVYRRKEIFRFNFDRTVTVADFFSSQEQFVVPTDGAKLLVQFPVRWRVALWFVVFLNLRPPCNLQNNKRLVGLWGCRPDPHSDA
jgi:hypothetical protein